MAANQTWAKIATVVTRDDFYRESHRLIFDAMVQLIEYHRSIDYVTLKDALMVLGTLEPAGGPAYVASLTDGVPKSVNVEHYAAIVKEHARLRAVIHAANTTLTHAYAVEPSNLVIEAGVRQLLGLSGVTAQDCVTLGGAVNQYISAFDAAAGGDTGLRLGYPDLDQFFAGGVGRQQMMIIAARPSIGKTTLGMNIAENIAGTGTPVGFFSLEMSPITIGEAALARNAQIDLHRLKTGAIGERDWARISHAVEVTNTLPIHIVEHVRTYTQFDAWCRRLKDEFKAQVAVLDYIQLMGAAQTRDRQQEMSFLSRSTKATARELDMLIIVISQLSRAPEERKDKRPQLSDLRESGALEQDADVVLLIFREDFYNKDPNHPDAGTAEIIVAKNRLGPTGVARLAFLREQLRFASLAISA